MCEAIWVHKERGVTMFYGGNFNVLPVEMCSTLPKLPTENPPISIYHATAIK